MKACAVVVAAGQGNRFGLRSGQPKQFLKLAGQPLLSWSLQALDQATSVQSMVLVLASNKMAWGRQFLRRKKFRKKICVVQGGAERFESARQGLNAAPPDAHVLMIHDAARPLVSSALVDRVARAAFQTGAALAAWPLSDTLKKERNMGTNHLVKETIPRAGLWLAQTPQAFRRDVWERLTPHDFRGVTDDVQAAERRGQRVALVKGSATNFKITWPDDWNVAESLLRNS